MGEVTIRTDDILSVQDAAKLLGRPRLAVYRMIKRGTITGIELGGVMFVPTSEIKRLKEEGVKIEENELTKSE